MDYTTEDLTQFAQAFLDGRDLICPACSHLVTVFPAERTAEGLPVKFECVSCRRSGTHHLA